MQMKQLPVCPIPQIIADFLDNQVETVRQFCKLQKERMNIERNCSAKALEVELCKQVQECANLELEVTNAELQRVEVLPHYV